MDNKRIDEMIDQVLREEQELPEGLSDRLEQYIDQLAAKEKRQKRTVGRKRALYWFGGVAAALLLGIAVFFQTEQAGLKPTTADTFSDPQQAAIAAQEALAFMSIQLNKGLDQVTEAHEEVNKVNDIVNKQLQDIQTQ